MQRIFLQQSIDRVGERCREFSADAGNAVPGNQSERIEIASPIDVVGGGLFRAHEFRRANDFTDAGKPGFDGRRRADDARSAEVSERIPSR